MESYLTEAQRKTAIRIARYGTRYEQYLLNWILENLVVIRRGPEVGALTIHYEDVVVDPGYWILRLQKVLGVELQTASSYIFRTSRSSRYSTKNMRRAINRGDAESRSDALLNQPFEQVISKEMSQNQALLDEFNIGFHRADSPTPRL
jgi:hypothetical protein